MISSNFSFPLSDVITEKFTFLPQSLKELEKKAAAFDWNPETNPSVKGTVQRLQPSVYLEGIANTVFQLDVAITCIDQHFNALNLKIPNSYKNLMNNIIQSTEAVKEINEFLIKSKALTS